jgi:hypothetical protein
VTNKSKGQYTITDLPAVGGEPGLVVQVARPALRRGSGRRADLDAAVAAMFDDTQGLHGSPRLHAAW